ncbi:hypothetical protein [Brevibacterium luteolum]|uniref:hypothetical protein n=1 Tax=Brevibacterium luteolum TaxID=199591 RepID=UPI001C2374D5|nr:hypothetical protein [Brevibacterium luteolum]MBU8580013.1 hypothetical protein [Brevibacterium luteolum]
MGTIDRAQLLRDLKTLEDSEFVVLTGQIDDQAHGHEIAAELAAEADLPELSYIFIHRQTIERSFHAGGSLRAPVQLHWGGSYDLILDRLAYLPEPWVALDFGEDHAFEVTVPEVGFEDVIELPEPDSPVREIRSAATQLSDAGEMNDDALEWIVEVLGSGSPKAQAAVLDVASQHLTTPAVLEAVIAAWPDAYRAYGDSAPVRQLLDTLFTSSDDRFAEVLASAERQRAWSFRRDAATVLAERRPPDALARLRKLARAQDRRHGGASNPPAVRGYIEVLAAEKNISVAEAAEQVAIDSGFADGARQEAVQTLLCASHPDPEPLRSPRGALAYLRTGLGTPELRKRVFETGADHRIFLASGADPKVERTLIDDLLVLTASEQFDVQEETVARLRERLSEL